jgi:hypothetical protein
MASWVFNDKMRPSLPMNCCFSELALSDLIFSRFKAEFCFFYSGFYCYDSFFIVYSILLLADFCFFVGFVKSGLHYETASSSFRHVICSHHDIAE